MKENLTERYAQLQTSNCSIINDGEAQDFLSAIYDKKDETADHYTLIVQNRVIDANIAFIYDLNITVIEVNVYDGEAAEFCNITDIDHAKFEHFRKQETFYVATRTQFFNFVSYYTAMNSQIYNRCASLI